MTKATDAAVAICLNETNLRKNEVCDFEDTDVASFFKRGPNDDDKYEAFGRLEIGELPHPLYDSACTNYYTITGAILMRSEIPDPYDYDCYVDQAGRIWKFLARDGGAAFQFITAPAYNYDDSINNYKVHCLNYPNSGRPSAILQVGEFSDWYLPITKGYSGGGVTSVELGIDTEGRNMADLFIPVGVEHVIEFDDGFFLPLEYDTWGDLATMNTFPTRLPHAWIEIPAKYVNTNDCQDPMDDYILDCDDDETNSTLKTPSDTVSLPPPASTTILPPFMRANRTAIAERNESFKNLEKAVSSIEQDLAQLPSSPADTYEGQVKSMIEDHEQDVADKMDQLNKAFMEGIEEAKKKFGL